MKKKIKLLPMLLAAVAVGFMLYRSLSFAEETSVATGFAAASHEYGVAGASGSQYGIPHDITYSKTVKSVVFSHQAHVADRGFKCDACHTGIFQMKANTAESRPDFNMKGMAEGKYCGSCHSTAGKTAFSSGTQCARCHRGAKGLEQAEAAGNSQEG